MKQKLLLCFLATFLALASWANGTAINGIYYVLDSNTKTASVTFGYGNYFGGVTIPSTVTYNDETYSVTSIGEGAFYACYSLTSINIPNSVTSIGNSAFRSCSSLTSITIPNSVTSIGNEAFQSCSGLTSVTIPNSVTSIGNSAFRNCHSVTSITVDAGNSVYDSRENCNAIIETSSNTLIVGCKNSTIPGSVTSIGNWVFSYCSSLTNITIPNSVTSIGGGAFSYCSLTSITIPSSVTSIGEYAFSSCSSLTSITIPNSVTSIGRWAFSYCSCLTSINIPNSVTSIGDYAFSSCSSLKSINVDTGNFVYDSRENCNAIIKTSRNTLIVGCKNSTIPNSVKSIGDMAFSNCIELMSITIPNSVEWIGDHVFYNCI